MTLHVALRFKLYKVFLCFPGDPGLRCRKVSYNGVLLTGYKQMCREGYVWVPWRRKCFKQNTLK